MFLVKVYRLLLCVKGMFIPFVIQSLFSFVVFIFNWKTRLENVK